MKSFITKSKFGVWQFNIPLFNNELSLFIERLQVLQGTLPQMKPTFKENEFNEMAYTTVQIYDSGLDQFVKKDVMQIFYDYIKANSPVEENV